MCVYVCVCVLPLVMAEVRVCLPVVHVTNGPYVQVRFVSREDSVRIEPRGERRGHEDTRRPLQLCARV